MITSAPVHEIAVDTVSRWEAFFQGTEYMQKVREIGDLYPEVSSIIVAYSDLDRYDSDLAVQLLEHPDTTLTAGKQAVRSLMHAEMADAEVTVRTSSLPRDVRVSIRDLRGRTLGRLISFEALVTRATQVKQDVRVGLFRCSRCGVVVRHQMDGQLYSEPLECYKEQDGCGRTASSTKFRLLADESETVDVQKIECQEPLESSKGGTSPARIIVWLSGELAGTVTAGNRIIVNGIPRMVKSADKPKSTVMDIEVEAVSVEMQGQEFADLEISDEEAQRFEAEAHSPDLYSHLIASIAPSIRGHDMEKAGMLLQMFGGLPKVLDDGSRLRGDIHILLVGDPGVAKSAMVRHASLLAPRGVYASGKSSSAAGLTVAATKDEFGEGRWTLEAGAMVLADQGFLGIDELDKMREEDRSSMHEGMEQQQISVNKAGITATLPTRCSILAAMNPKWGRFDISRPLIDQLDIPDTLISRFDLIFCIQDRPNKVVDGEISGHILASHRRGAALANRGEEGMEAILAETEAVTPYYDAVTLRKYIAYGRRLRPVLTHQAMDAIQQHYVNIRRLGDEDDAAVPITARQLEGYVRLAEASARSRLSKWVEEIDARRAIDLVEYYLNLFTPTDGAARDIDRVMTSVPKRDRGKIMIVLDIIKGAGREGISASEVAEVADDMHHIEEHETRAIIRRLKEKGEVMEIDVARGLLRAVE